MSSEILEKPNKVVLKQLQPIDLLQDVDGMPQRYLLIVHKSSQLNQDFCIGLLKTIFSKTDQEAVSVWNNIMTQGFGVANTYISKDIAETVKSKALTYAQRLHKELILSIEGFN